MWLTIISLLDKLFSVLGQLVGFWIKRSDESKKVRDEAQKQMDDAAIKGDFDAWKTARYKRNNA